MNKTDLQFIKKIKLLKSQKNSKGPHRSHSILTLTTATSYDMKCFYSFLPPEFIMTPHRAKTLEAKI